MANFYSKTIIGLLILLLAQNTALPQKRLQKKLERSWQSGAILLQTGEILEGEIIYEYSNLLLFRDSTGHQVFTSKQIDRFRLHHRQAEGKYREFIILDLSEEVLQASTKGLFSENSFNKSEIFEVLRESNDYILLSKKRVYEELELESFHYSNLIVPLTGVGFEQVFLNFGTTVGMSPGKRPANYTDNLRIIPANPEKMYLMTQSIGIGFSLPFTLQTTKKVNYPHNHFLVTNSGVLNLTQMGKGAKRKDRVQVRKAAFHQVLGESSPGLNEYLEKKPVTLKNLYEVEKALDAYDGYTADKSN